MEAILLRVVRLERRQCAVFVAPPFETTLRLDYSVETQGANFGLRSGLILPDNTRLVDCRVLGYTAQSDETWVKSIPLHIGRLRFPLSLDNYSPGLPE
jgi:hypothetical protein